MTRSAYRVLSVNHHMGTGVADSYNFSISAIAKSNYSIPYCIPNELICSRIGQFLCLPLPPSGIVHVPGLPSNVPAYWFASMDFNLAGDSLPPIDPNSCVTELSLLSTGLLLFDVLITNSDRHAGNLALLPSTFSDAPKMNVFDHSHALFGYAPGQGIPRLNSLKGRLGISGGPYTSGNRHCLLDEIGTCVHFNEWIERIKSLPNFFVREVCKEAVGLGIDDIEANEVYNFLTHRRDNIRDIIEANKAEFTSITEWNGVF